MRTLGILALSTVGTLALALAPAATAGERPDAGRHGPDRPHGWTGGWDETVLDADQSFRGLDAVDRRTAWVSGESVSGGAGTVWRTTDGGASWEQVGPPDSDGLMFRDVEALDADTAHVLAIGPGEASRIYRTDDGGESWTETFRNAEEAAFYNCMDFYPGGRRGLAVSDPVDGKFRIAATDDGGRSWEVLPDEGMPDATGEYNFSASGDCLVVAGRDAWFGSGGSDSRVFHSRDRGRTWTASASTIPAGEAAGVFGLAFRSPRHGFAVGGDFSAPDDGADATAATRDGRRWSSQSDLAHLGEDVAWLPGTPDWLLVVGQSGAVGGTSVSTDGGRSWTQLEDVGHHVLDCPRPGACFAAGSGGRVGTF